MGIANEKILKAMSIYEYILMCLDFPCTSINKYRSSYFRLAVELPLHVLIFPYTLNVLILNFASQPSKTHVYVRHYRYFLIECT